MSSSGSRTPSESQTPRSPPGYEGQLNEAGLPHGYGKQLCRNGDVYEGSWYEGKPHGRGVYRYVSGAFYDGEFEMGIRHGRGRYAYVNGQLYDGMWVKGKRQGQGKLISNRNVPADQCDVYEGEFSDGNQEGKGTLRYGNGDVYTGQFKQGLRSGLGILTYANGNKFQGLWMLDRPNGFGAFTVKQLHRHFVGIFKDGQLAEELCVPPKTPAKPSAPPHIYKTGDTKCERCGQERAPCPSVPPPGSKTLSPATSALSNASPIPPQARPSTAPISSPGTSSSTDKPPLVSVESVPSSSSSSATPGILKRPSTAATTSSSGGAALLSFIPSATSLPSTPAESRSHTPEAERKTSIGGQQSSSTTPESVLAAVRKALASVKTGLGMSVADMAVKAGKENSPDKGAAGTVKRVRIVEVSAFSPAAAASLGRGDYITSFNEKPIATKRQLLAFTQSQTPGSVCQLGYVSRSGSKVDKAKVVIGANIKQADYELLSAIEKRGLGHGQLPSGFRSLDELQAWVSGIEFFDYCITFDPRA
jgi:hypothetical protein